LSWGGTLSVDAGEVTVHRLGPRSDKDPNEADAPRRHGCRTEHGHGARSPGTPRHGAPSLDPRRSPPGPGGWPAGGRRPTRRPSPEPPFRSVRTAAAVAPDAAPVHLHHPFQRVVEVPG